MTVCPRCGRPTVLPDGPWTPRSMAQPQCVVRVVVRHAGKGCDSGCCGHEVVGYDCEGREVYEHFEFDHPGSADRRVWATSLVSHLLPGVEIDWPECEIYDD